MKTDFTLPLLPPPPEIETREILKQLTLSHRHLAELKGGANPHQYAFLTRGKKQ